MAWPHFTERVTVIDVLDVACIDKVLEWIDENGKAIVVQAREHARNDYIQRAANNTGYGSGYGSGYGYGYGYGYGDGDGDGDGYGGLAQ